MSDGSYLAAMYPDPVHYQTEDGEWQEIDNRLEEVPVQEDEFFAQEGEDEVVSEEHSETNSQPAQEANSAPEQKPGSSEADGSSQTVSEATEESTISSESVSSEVVSSQTESQPDDSLGNESTPVNTVPEAEEETQTVSQVLSAKSMEKADADDSTELQNKANTTKIKLSNKLKSGKTVTVQTEEGKIRWGLDGAKKVKHQVVSNPQKLDGDDAFLFLQNLTSIVRYADIFPDVDVEYILFSNRVKENIILKSRQAQQEFTETYEIGNLSVCQVDDKTIELFDEKDPDTVVYTIRAPEMTDSNGESSMDITLSIVEQKKKYLVVQIQADGSWLDEKDRAYPVTLDPVMEVDQGKPNIEDVFLSSNMASQNLNNMGSVYVGRESANYGICRTLVNFHSLPTLSPGDMVVSAQLNMLQMPNGMSPSNGSMKISVHEVTSNWTASSATWNNMSGSFDPTVIDYAVVNGSTNYSYSSWNVSKIVKGWYNGTKDQYGFMLKATDESQAVRTQYFASENSTPSGYYPGLMISYVNNAGLEGRWTYHTQSAGRAGVGYVNDYTGNLVFAAPVTGTTGERAPLSVDLYYNGYQAGRHFKNLQKGMSNGWGWKLNVIQRIDVISESNGTTENEKQKFKELEALGYKYAYLDADGTEHFFKLKENSSTEYEDEEGLKLKLTVHSNPEYYWLEFDDGSKSTFTSSGYLYRVYDSDSNYLEMTYGGAMLRSIKDGAGRVTTFTCNEHNVLTKIVAPDNRATTFTYSGGNLAAIHYPDGKSVEFAYDGNDRLVEAVNPDTSSIRYSYTDQGYEISQNRVASVKEFSSDQTVGNQVSFTYNADNSTTFTYDTSTGIVTEVTNFDGLGRSTSTINQNDFSAVSYSYTPSSVKDHTANKLTSFAATSSPVQNLLRDHSMEKANVVWSMSNWSQPGGTIVKDTSTAYLGNASYKITQNQSNPTRCGIAQEITNLIPGETGLPMR